MIDESKGKPAPTIRDLYPGFDDQQLQEAEENLERYLEVALRIDERIKSDPEAYARFRSLTDSKVHPTMRSKRSNG